MRLKRVDHIGVVVDDLAEAADLLSRGFGLSLGTTLERDQLRAQFYRCGDVSIELIEIVDPELRAKRLGDRTARIEHIAIEVEDLEAALETLEAIGVRPNAAPRRSDDSVSIWTDPDTTDGVSYQFMQKDGSDRAQ